MFENCSCIADNLASQLLERGSPHGYGINDTDTLSSLLLTNGTAVDGRCDQGCNKLGPFLFITAVIIFFILTLYVPYIITTVRWVNINNILGIILQPGNLTENFKSWWQSSFATTNLKLKSTNINFLTHITVIIIRQSHTELPNLDPPTPVIAIATRAL